ncbi:MAG: HIT family protein [Planctomycetota bacterium]|jgi:histidine triad (HIT) family protein
MTIFARILEGDIPCHRVYEDDHVLAFLDIGPASPGHTLVIPKERVAGVHELSDDASAAIGRVLPRLCRAVMKVTGATQYNVLANAGEQAGQEVPHVHFHIIPKTEEGGMKFTWQPGSLDGDTGARCAEAIREMLAAD